MPQAYRALSEATRLAVRHEVKAGLSRFETAGRLAMSVEMLIGAGRAGERAGLERFRRCSSGSERATAYWPECRLLWPVWVCQPLAGFEVSAESIDVGRGEFGLGGCRR